MASTRSFVADQGLFVPIGIRHRFANEADEDAFIVFALTPLAPGPTSATCPPRRHRHRLLEHPCIVRPVANGSDAEWKRGAACAERRWSALGSWPPEA